MSDPKKAAPADKAKEAHETHLDAVSSPQRRLIAIGRLRRDTMILASDEDSDVINKLAASAVREGRAAEVYVVEAVGYFSESEVDFVEAEPAREARRFDQGSARVPLLNPSTGEQSADVAKESPGEAPQAETPTGGAKTGGDDNKGAGTGTGNEAALKGETKSKDA